MKRLKGLRSDHPGLTKKDRLGRWKIAGLRRVATTSVLRICAIVLVAHAAYATDGVVEINQTCALTGCFSGDAAGFPVTISTAGSYRLTGMLSLTTDDGGILIATNDVTLDLNGFRIDGPSLCAPISCTTGSSDGIGTSSSLVGQRVRVTNGTVSGFSGSCVALSAFAHVSGLMIQSCGGTGIDVGVGSIVLGNAVGNVGEEGLKLGANSTFAHNTIMGSARSNATAFAVLGGSPSAGNVCEDGTCTARGERRFYLTKTSYDGAAADNRPNCATGFHFASLFEIHDPTSLRYDTIRGETRDDSGQGPPTLGVGWIRTGYDADVNGGIGRQNCSAWTSSVLSDGGSVVHLSPSWRDPGEHSSPWFSFGYGCSSTLPIWCVED